ncbi:subtilisin-like serine protease [Halovivax ruber XH-70]|uniref:Subtilisin-like serine protease n=1 Tax=Halovivax ruber (strain DSM 18193 / JCM 13892 / XH-70) TaxID=797302 RepID=L0IAG1_HALRX|nr:S8 family serine peptidase [Halovivax ruber]AGB15231.1 subtilisin-like serine protease [Halovivax ruber XH-70]
MSGDGNHDIGRRSVLKAAGATGAFLGLGGVVSATPGREPGPKEDEILVGKSDTVGIASARTTVESAIPAEASVVHENDALGYMAVKVPEDGPSTQDSVIERLERQPGIEYAEPNYTVEAFLEPNDPQFGSQYAPQQVRADQAWDTTMGSMDVTIAVVDQGVDYTHPDLADRFQGDEGYDFVDNDDDPAPVVNSENHGTHVGGCAAATTDNNEGTAGISNCRLISGRALGSGGSGSMADIADAIQWAADQGADIVNLSLGGGGASDTGRNAIDYAYNNGTLPIAAAGNDYGSPVSYPAAYDNCVAVSAVDQNEQIANFSNYGPNVNVAAPGVDVLAPVPGGGYEGLSGTSMACPVASGVAALGKSAHPDDSVQDLWDRLESTAVDIGLPTDQQGSGRVDAANIVEGGGGGDPGSPTASFGFSPSDPEVDETVAFDASGSTPPDGGSITSYEWDLGDGATKNGETIDHRFGAEGDYSVQLTVTAGNGETDTSTQTVAIGGDGGGGQCGAETSSDSVSGYLSGGWWGNGSDNYTYSLDTANPCQATVTLSGPYSADFDLYLTYDGRTPTTYDYDEVSYSPDSQEEITVDLSGDEELGLLVDAYSGSGSYTLTVDELGQ